MLRLEHRLKHGPESGKNTNLLDLLAGESLIYPRLSNALRECIYMMLMVKSTLICWPDSLLVHWVNVMKKLLK